MLLKQGVKTTGLRPEMLLALLIADQVYAKHDRNLVVTSITDGHHSRGSLHYVGQAGDLRTRYFDPEQVEVVAADLRTALGGCGEDDAYDIVVEDNHIHMEWQPKNGA